MMIYVPFEPRNNISKCHKPRFLCYQSILPLLLCYFAAINTIILCRSGVIQDWMRAGRYENWGPKHGWNKNTYKPLCCEDMYSKYFVICRCGGFWCGVGAGQLLWIRRRVIRKDFGESPDILCWPRECNMSTTLNDIPAFQVPSWTCQRQTPSLNAREECSIHMPSLQRKLF